ncbi:hypothetical protein [Bacillus pumilus]|uniref:hypothetical protein n=1 Tax=Bacillus pumilus TaxID=1408 RepID=UPI00330581E8
MTVTTIQKLKEQIAQQEEKLKKAREKLQKDVGKKLLDTFDAWEKDPKEINKLIADLHAKYESDSQKSVGESDDNRIGNNSAQ